MGQMAVDVVLLPDEAMTRRAIALNRQLLTSGRPEIVLNPHDCLPHISLAMGCIDTTDVTAIGERLGRLARRTQIKKLNIVGVVAFTNARGETTSLLDVEKAEELQALHEQVMEETKAFFHYDVTEAMIHDDVVAPSTLDWIRSYPEKAGYERFRPHITLGYGAAPADLAFPLPFAVTRLAVCHLGNHCTCRTVLAAVPLE